MIIIKDQTKASDFLFLHKNDVLEFSPSLGQKDYTDFEYAA